MTIFKATHGVTFQEAPDDKGQGGGVWAQFKPASKSPILEDGVAAVVYIFETDDKDAIARLRKVDDYGIEEVKGKDVDDLTASDPDPGPDPVLQHIADGGRPGEPLEKPAEKPAEPKKAAPAKASPAKAADGP